MRDPVLHSASVGHSWWIEVFFYSSKVKQSRTKELGNFSTHGCGYPIDNRTTTDSNEREECVDRHGDKSVLLFLSTNKDDDDDDDDDDDVFNEKVRQVNIFMRAVSSTHVDKYYSS